MINDEVKLMLGDCLERMKEIPDGSIDAIITDPPYGTTACKWDSIIHLEPMWEQLKRIIKPNRAIVMTASQPFTITLIASNMKMFKYCWVWRKERGTGFQVAKFRPMIETEDCVVFCNGKGKIYTYNPQMIKLDKPKKENYAASKSGSNPLAHIKNGERIATHRYPKNIIEISRDKERVHPTQKPVSLMEYLIKTYTNEGDTVLDFTMGSGSTGVAAVNTNRNFIGIELDEGYFDIADKRITDAYKCRSGQDEN